jgi:hypothetical protein
MDTQKNPKKMELGRSKGSLFHAHSCCEFAGTHCSVFVVKLFNVVCTWSYPYKQWLSENIIKTMTSMHLLWTREMHLIQFFSEKFWERFELSMMSITISSHVCWTWLRLELRQSMCNLYVSRHFTVIAQVNKYFYLQANNYFNAACHFAEM